MECTFPNLCQPDETVLEWYDLNAVYAKFKLTPFSAFYRDMKTAVRCIHRYTRSCWSFDRHRHFDKMFRNTARMVHELCTNEHYQTGNFPPETFFFSALGLIVNVIFYSLLKTFCLYVDRSYRSHCLSEEIHQGYGKIAIQRARTVSWSNLKKKERSIRWKNQKSVLVSYVILEAIISTSLNNWKSKLWLNLLLS